VFGEGSKSVSKSRKPKMSFEKLKRPKKKFEWDLAQTVSEANLKEAVINFLRAIPSVKGKEIEDIEIGELVTDGISIDKRGSTKTPVRSILIKFAKKAGD
jgi:hypothetical protein